MHINNKVGDFELGMIMYMIRLSFDKLHVRLSTL
jgi:hypothetical protein